MLIWQPLVSVGDVLCSEKAVCRCLLLDVDEEDVGIGQGDGSTVFNNKSDLRGGWGNGMIQV